MTEHKWISLFYLAVFKILRTKIFQGGRQGRVQGETDRSTSSFSDEEGDMGMSSSSSSEHLAVDRDVHLQLCDPVLWPLLFPSFLCFTRRFWNQIFTCFSDKFRYVAISMRLSLERYMLEVNSRSSSKSCVLVKAVRMRLLLWSLLLLFSVKEKNESDCQLQFIFLKKGWNVVSSMRSNVQISRYSPIEMQWNCRGSGTEYAAWYIPGACRLTPLDEECCLDSAEWQYCELKGGKVALRSGSVGGDGWSWDAVMHRGQKHSSPAFLEWQEPGIPCGWCGECTAYGNKGGLFSFPLSLASLKIKESTRKDLGMFANVLLSVGWSWSRASSRQPALLGTVDSEVVLKAHRGSLNSRRGLGSAMWRLRCKRPKALNRVLCLSLGIPTARFPIISLVN